MHPTDAVTQILQPHGPIGIGISILMWVLTAAAIAAAAFAGRRHRNPQETHANGRVVGHLDVEDEIRGGLDRLAEAIPGIILLIGLLGTFSSLARAINEAAAGLQAAQADQLGASGVGAMRHLSGLLDNMGTKFQTSILGIVLSILTRAFVFALCVLPRRAAVKRIVVAGENATSEAEQAAKNAAEVAMGAAREANDLAFTSFNSHFSDVVDLLQALAQKLSEVATREGESRLNQHNEMLAEMKSNSEAAKQQSLTVCDKLTEIKTSLGTLTNASEALQKGAKNIEKAAANLDIGVAKFTEASQDTSAQLNTAIETMSGSLAASLKELVGSVAELNNGTAASAKASREAMTGAMSAFEKSTSKTLGDVGAGLATMMTDVATENKKATTVLQTSMNAFAESSATANEQSQKQMASALSDFKTSTEKTSKSMVTGIGAAAGEIQNSVEGSKTTLESALSRLDRQMGTLTENLDKGITPLAKYSALIVANIDQLNGQLVQQEAFFEKLDRNINTMREVLGRALVRENRLSAPTSSTEPTP